MAQNFFPSYSRDILQFDPLNLKADPERFQFKSGGDRYGVTAQLLSVKEWEAAFSGIVYVWQAEDGGLYITDGHQRLALALRIQRAPDGEPITLRGCLFREQDGWTIEKMRVFAAAKNIAEGGESTKAVDVAKLLRNGGPVEFLEQHVSSQRRCYRDGKSLANLSEDCFNLVLNGIVPDQWGIVVGERVNDHKQQIAIIDFLKKSKPRADNIVDLVEEAIASGFIDQTQTNLFGETDIAHALISERIKIYAHCRKELKACMEALDGSLKKRREFQLCGIEINVPAVERQLHLRSVMRQMIKQSRMKSQLSTALTQAARMYQKEGSIGPAAAHFMDALEMFSRPFLPQRQMLVPCASSHGPGNDADISAPTLPIFLPQATGLTGEQAGLF